MTYDTDPPPIDQNSAEVGLVPFFANAIGNATEAILHLGSWDFRT
jgi:hypothetical protein